MNKVYIASPYTIGDVEKNVQVQKDMFNQLISLGFIPFAPLWSHFQHKQYPLEYDTWLNWDFQWLKCCDYLLRLPGISSGADKEVQYALKLGIPVYYSLEELVFSEKTTNTNYKISEDTLNKILKLLEYELAEQEILLEETEQLLDKFLEIKDGKNSL